MTIESSSGAPLVLQTLPIKSLYDFTSLLKPDGDYNRERQRLQQLVAESNGDEKNLNRFNLAQFFVVNNHAADALWSLGYLGNSKSGSGNLYRDPAVVALRGLTRIMMNDGKNAAGDLNERRLDGIPAIGWWRGAALAIEEDWIGADKLFATAGEIPASYPSEFKAMLLQYAAESAFGAGKIERTRSLLFGFPVGIKNQSLSNRVDYLKAQLLLSKDDEVDDRLALAILDRLAKDGNAWGRRMASGGGFNSCSKRDGCRWIRRSLGLKGYNMPGLGVRCSFAYWLSLAISILTSCNRARA